MSPDDRFRAGRRSRVIDVRGRVHELCEVADLPAESPRMLREAVAAANKHRLAVQLRGMAIAGAIFFGLLLLARQAGWLGAGWSGPWPVYWVLSLIGGLIGGKSQARAAAVHAVRTCVACEVCPACAYSLRGLGEEGDGCRVCPECGGAWGSGKREGSGK